MTRRQYIGLGVSALWTSCQALGNFEDECTVIVHPSNRFDALSRSKVSYLFLRKVSRWPWGAEVAPLDLAQNERVRRVFVQRVLGISEEQLAEYWIDQRATRGVNPPLQVRDAAAAKIWVAARPGGIAYVPSSVVDATVKVLRINS
jgi:hypothetical protein